MNKMPSPKEPASKAEQHDPHVKAMLRELVSEVAKNGNIPFSELQANTAATLLMDKEARNNNPLTAERIEDPSYEAKIMEIIQSRTGIEPGGIVQDLTVGPDGLVKGRNMSASAMADMGEQLRENPNDITKG